MKKLLQRFGFLIPILLQWGCATEPPVVETPPPAEFEDYYDQVHAQIENVWPPLVREKFSKLYSEGRTIAPRNEDCESLVGVDVRENGKIVSTVLLKPCGITAADEAAVEAFEKISVLPPPPKKVLKQGMTQVKWNFILLK